MFFPLQFPKESLNSILSPVNNPRDPHGHQSLPCFSYYITIASQPFLQCICSCNGRLINLWIGSVPPRPSPPPLPSRMAAALIDNNGICFWLPTAALRILEQLLFIRMKSSSQRAPGTLASWVNRALPTHPLGRTKGGVRRNESC